MNGAARPVQGFVLVAVVIVVAAAILVATGALFAARASTAAARSSESERLLRAAALDGVAATASAMHAQRAEILRGATPALEPLVFVRDDAGDRLEVRLMPLPAGGMVESEGAKLDANAVDAATLAKVAVDASREAQELAETLAQARPLESLDGAAGLAAAGARGPALKALLGTLRFLGEADEARSAGASEPLPLVSLLTVHARESLLDRDGARRLDLVAAFGDGSGAGEARASLAMFDDAEREVLARVAESARKSGGADDGAIAKALLARGVKPERIDEILDRTTLAEGDVAAPRLDLLRADARVLAAVRGLDDESAARIVDLRESLDDAERLGTSWLLARRVLDAGRWATVAGRLSHRSTAWRFRVEARRMGSEDADSEVAPVSDRRDAGVGSTAAGGEAVAAFDCIVDVAGDSPRIVFLRDVSLLPSARLLLASEVAAAGAGSTRGDAVGAAPRVPIAEASPDEASSPFASRAGDAGGISDAADSPVGDLEPVAQPATIGSPAERTGAGAVGRDVAPRGGRSGS